LANPLLGAAAGVKIAKDLGSRSYGIEIHDSVTKEELVSNLILRTDPLIFEGTSSYCTSNDGQTSVFIAISENTSIERTIPRYKGKRLSAQNITWGYPVPKHTTVTAKVKRGADGIVHIEVECKNKKVFFDIKPENALSLQEMRELRNELNNMQF
jgi:hypothetical protein